jgi:hypothetical protein
VQGTVAGDFEEKKLVMPEKIPPEGAGAVEGAPASGAPAIGTFAGEGAAGTLLGEDIVSKDEDFWYEPIG